MTFKTACVAVVLSLAPVMTLAMGCSERGNHAQSCAPGTAWDSNLQSCVKQVTG